MEKLSNSYPLKKHQVAYKEMLDEIVLLNLTTGVYYSSNKSGACIWECCDGTHSFENIKEKLMEVFGIGANQAHDHLVEFITDLEQEGLIDINES